MHMFNKEALIISTKGCENVLRAGFGVFICSPFVWQSPPSAWCASPCRFWRHDQSELHSETHRAENASSSNLIRTVVLWHDASSPIWHVFLVFPLVSKPSPKVSTVSAQMKRQMMKKHLTSKFLYFSFSGLGGCSNEGSGPCDSYQPWCMFSNSKRHYFKESCMCVSARVRVWKPDSPGSSWLMDGVCDVSVTEHLCIYFLLVLFFFFKH